MGNAVIGALRVTLGLDSAAFEKGAKKAQQQGSSLASGLKKAFSGLGGILAGALAAFGTKQLFGKFIQGTTFAQAGQAQLAAALKSTGGAAGQTLKALNDNASALQAVTTYGDETTNTAQALLLTFTKVQGDTFPRATAAILDMATAMKIDLKSATLQVGKALNDPILGITALSRAGIQFSESQKKLIKDLVKSGDTAAAQAVILKELETQFGGSAKAARQTLGGAITALSNSFGDLFEISKSGSEGLRLAIESLVTAISNPTFIAFVKTIGVALFEAVGLATRGVAALVNGISGLFNWLASMPDLLMGIGVAMAIAFGPAILTMIGSLTVSVGALALASIQAAASFVTAWAAALSPLALIIAGIAAVVGAVFIFRDEIAQAIGVDIVATMKDAANRAIGDYVGAYEAIKATWSQFPKAIGDLVIQAANAVIGGVEGMVNKVIGLINTALDRVNAVMKKMPFGIGESFDPFSQIGSVSWGRLPNIFAGAANKAANEWKSIMADARNTDYIGGAKDLATRYISNAKDRILGLQDEINGGTMPGAANAAGGGGGGGGGGKKGKADPYAEIIKSGERRIAELKQERAAIGLSEEAAAKLKYQTDLLNQAQQKGISLTAEQTNKLMSLAGEMGTLEVAVSKAKDAFEFSKSTTKGFFSDLKSGLQNGEGLWKSFGKSALNVLDKIANRRLDGVIDSFFSSGSVSAGSGGKSAGGGIFGSILSGFGKLFHFANGGQFQVGGAGGVDSQLVAFRASPNETVNVSTPQQMRAANQNRNGAVPLNVNIAGASGDAHIVALARQGVAEGLRQYDKSQRRGGVGENTRFYEQQKG